MLGTLATIGSLFEKKNIIWGLGGSLLLHFHDIVDNPNDIDLLVAERDFPYLHDLMSKNAVQIDTKSKKPFCSTYFQKYHMDTTDVDMMGTFAIEHELGIYKLELDVNSITEYVQVKGVCIPLTSLEDWFILYQLIPNKRNKAEQLEDYFCANGVKYPKLLEKALQQPLPFSIKERVENLIIK
ncbi:hypothetical protein HNQ94_001100 [Salirhabdus euzebyi]|uniref:Nucleotidyl transferase AbiEii/AbiGii toxin family protein n=1 Tax=Salirhabdus euzebyi TaxID=394506 RepID=A0A841PXC0_9BACI|nr:hypothetical protein [Salirhabdus euzebyi]MBB6452654.1 hypothetical protein [Salirhabdus euzebyi]